MILGGSLHTLETQRSSTRTVSTSRHFPGARVFSDRNSQITAFFNRATVETGKVNKRAHNQVLVKIISQKHSTGGESIPIQTE
jgi:hypothetical protein